MDPRTPGLRRLAALIWQTTRRLGVSLLHSDFLVLILAAAYALALAPLTPGFWSTGNAVYLLLALLPLFLVALGETVVLITGGIDLSLPAVLGLSSVAGAAVMSADSGWLGGHALAVPAGLAVMLAVGSGVGLVNGLAVSVLRMPPFIVTLTTMMFFGGVAVWVTQAKTIGDLPAAFNVLGAELSSALVFATAVAIGLHLLLSRTLVGRWFYAVGHNARAALISGVPVMAVTVAAYVISGLLGSAGAFLYTAQAESGSPELGKRLLLDVVGGAVIGGTSLFGGRGKVVWTLYGVLFIKLIDNSLNLLGLSHFTIMMVKGGVILAAAGMDGLRRRSGGGDA
jgi:ribose/xylose/arabinose/galactoside ABC-type transport system permease subunit